MSSLIKIKIWYVCFDGKEKLYHQNQHYVGHIMYVSHDKNLMKFLIWLIWFNHLNMTDYDCNVISDGVTIIK